MNFRTPELLMEEVVEVCPFVILMSLERDSLHC